MPTIIDVSVSQTYWQQEALKTPDDQLQEVSLRFIREVKKVRGPDDAIAVINSLSDTLGKQWSSKIIFDILGQDVSSTPTIEVTYRSIHFNQPIAFIKAIRMATGMGLKESKDLYEKLRDEVQKIEIKNAMAPIAELPILRIPVHEARYKEVVNEFRSIGVIVL